MSPSPNLPLQTYCFPFSSIPSTSILPTKSSPFPMHDRSLAPLGLCTCFPSPGLPFPDFPHLVTHSSFKTPSRVSFFLEIGGPPATWSSHLFKPLALTMILNLLPTSQELLPMHNESLGKLKPKLNEIPLHVHWKAVENHQGGETWDPYTLEVGMQNGAATTENSLVILQKVKCGVIMWLSNLTPMNISKIYPN